MRRDRSVYLRHIADLVERVKAYTADGEGAFRADPKTQDAVLHNLEIIGQCVKDYGVEELEEASAQVPWRQIAALRNVLAHQYLGVDVGLIWAIVVRDLPALERQVAQILLRLDTN